MEVGYLYIGWIMDENEKPGFSVVVFFNKIISWYYGLFEKNTIFTAPP